LRLNLIPLESAPLDLWEGLVTRVCAPPTYRPDWMRALAAAIPGSAPHLLLDRDPDGALRGGIPLLVRERLGLKSVHSLPFGVYGGPVVEERRAPVNGGTDDLAVSMARIAGGAGVFEFTMTCLAPPDDPRRPFPPSVDGWRAGEQFTQILDLGGGFPHVWAHRFTQGARNSVRRARRRGVTVESGRGAALLEDLYGLYRREAGHWHTDVIYPLVYFRELLGLFPGARVWVARSGRDIVAGKFLLREGPWILSRLGVVDPRARHLLPHHLLISEAAERAEGEGARWMDLGPSRGHAGVIRFKASFGAQPVPMLQYHRRTLVNRARRTLRRPLQYLRA
jgi:CelD/BcsL family acetyltransferase involved in cellulose biosynthesis